MAVGGGRQRLGDYVKNLVTRYLVLSMAGIPLLAAMAFAVLAIFWAINSWIGNPIYSAAIMVGIMGFMGLLIALIAYGITSQKPKSVSQALRPPLNTFQSAIPSVDDVGREIDNAVRRYGPLRVAAAAAAGGIIAGLVAKRYAHVQAPAASAQPRGRYVFVEEPPVRQSRGRKNSRPYA